MSSEYSNSLVAAVALHKTTITPNERPYGFNKLLNTAAAAKKQNGSKQHPMIEMVEYNST